MSESLIQQGCVREEGQLTVNLFHRGRIMTVLGKEAPANLVPAAAVIREERGLFMMIGCKAGQGDKYKFYLYQKLHLRKNLKN